MAKKTKEIPVVKPPAKLTIAPKLMQAFDEAEKQLRNEWMGRIRAANQQLSMAKVEADGLIGKAKEKSVQLLNAAEKEVEVAEKKADEVDQGMKRRIADNVQLEKSLALKQKISEKTSRKLNAKKREIEQREADLAEREEKIKSVIEGL